MIDLQSASAFAIPTLAGMAEGKAGRMARLGSSSRESAYMSQVEPWDMERALAPRMAADLVSASGVMLGRPMENASAGVWQWPSRQEIRKSYQKNETIIGHDISSRGKNSSVSIFNYRGFSILLSESYPEDADIHALLNLLTIAAESNRYSRLRDALSDLDQARDEAREEDFPVPTDTALRNARRLLRAMYNISPRRFEVYPTPDGEIAVDAPGGRGRSVLLLCESSGGALCLVNMKGAHRRARYSDASMLPDGFVREALDELDRRSGRST